MTSGHPGGASADASDAAGRTLPESKGDVWFWVVQ